MKQIPENDQDIKKLLYDQLPLLIERLRTPGEQDCLYVATAISEIVGTIQLIDR